MQHVRRRTPYLVTISSCLWSMTTGTRYDDLGGTDEEGVVRRAITQKVPPGLRAQGHQSSPHARRPVRCLGFACATNSTNTRQLSSRREDPKSVTQTQRYI